MADINNLPLIVETIPTSQFNRRELVKVSDKVYQVLDRYWVRWKDTNTWGYGYFLTAANETAIGLVPEDWMERINVETPTPA